MQIRAFIEDDWSRLWPIVRDIVRAAETFAYDPAMTEAASRDVWIETAPGLTVVAVEGERVLGTAKTGTNRPGPGAHVSTASFMVAADARGRGSAATPECSSTPLLSPIARLSNSTSGSASASSEQSPAPSPTRR